MAWSKTTKGWGAKKKPRKKGSRTNTRSKAPRRKATRRRYGSSGGSRTRVSTKLVCPSSWQNKPVKRAKNGACYVLVERGARFVKKVSAGGSNRSGFLPGGQSYLRGLRGKKRKAAAPRRRWRRR
jgi:hypothetical protein